MYKIETDERQYIFSKHVRGGDWEVLGYYHDLYFLLLKLIKIGCIDNRKARDLESLIKDTLKSLKTSILSAVEAPRSDDRW